MPSFWCNRRERSEEIGDSREERGLKKEERREMGNYFGERALKAFNYSQYTHFIIVIIISVLCNPSLLLGIGWDDRYSGHSYWASAGITAY